MFLTLDSWRHPNPSIQALVAPAAAWEHVGIDEIRPSLLFEVRHLRGSEVVGVEWLLSASVEALVDYLASAPERIGTAYVLVPSSLHPSGRWCLEQLAGIEEWSQENHAGLECHSTAGGRYSFPPRPESSLTQSRWNLPSR